MYFIGIDGGGTKTLGVIADQTGQIFAHAVTGATNMNSVGKLKTLERLRELLDALRNQKPEMFEQVSIVFAGLSGVEQIERRQEIAAYIQGVAGGAVEILVDNDAVIALYSGTWGEPGIVQIAGTGSITFAENDEGNRGRAGGWGYLISDEGSGYSLGREGLAAVFRAHDGTGNPTELTPLVLKHFQVGTVPDLISSIYQEQARERIAGVSRLVTEAADLGDEAALAIVNRAAEEQAVCIAAVKEKLFEADQVVPVVLAGGVFNRHDLFTPSIHRSLGERKVCAKIVIPELPPVAGAVLAACKKKGIQADSDFVDHFKETLNQAGFEMN
jgi:N-acetylglucosamine kinase-like BadF-type ATPase